MGNTCGIQEFVTQSSFFTDSVATYLSARSSSVKGGGLWWSYLALGWCPFAASRSIALVASCCSTTERRKDPLYLRGLDARLGTENPDSWGCVYFVR